ncbi:hypothetical protein TIFTF001_026496 [Ficus carica]|uniref:Uncharacterized protein n=1 Tax=Ficus carica TaxID=3494 RepID=A0AA88ITI0_FICCA|nr:hypothetical protein TIFTF001_026496 [Ficus carica]
MVVRRTGKCLQGGGRDWFTEPQNAREGVGGTGGDKDRACNVVDAGELAIPCLRSRRADHRATGCRRL